MFFKFAAPLHKSELHVEHFPLPPGSTMHPVAEEHLEYAPLKFFHAKYKKYFVCGNNVLQKENNNNYINRKRTTTIVEREQQKL